MKLIYSAAFLFLSVSSFAQIAWIDPAPSSATEMVTVYIDVNQSEGTLSNGLKAMLQNHPEMIDEVYGWFWLPSDPAAGNGSWYDSNEAMKLTWISDLVYSISFVPVDFFNADASTFYSSGISCIAKLDNGNAFFDDGVGEAKTEDLHIDIIELGLNTLSGITSPGIFPNPASDKVTILNPYLENMEVRLFDLNGKMITNVFFSNSVLSVQQFIPVETLEEGIYFIEVYTADRLTTQKLIVSHH